MSSRRSAALATVVCTLLASIAASPVGAQSPASSTSARVPQLGWQDELTGGTDKLDVATTVAPISSLAREIGGDRIRLHGLIPDATNSHTFEPSPSDARVLSKADVILVNGLHLEQPTLDLAEASKSPEAVIRFLGDNTITQADWLFDVSFPESAGDPNPHLWMSVPYALHYADLMRQWFADADPANAVYYSANFERLKSNLDDLDARIRSAVATVPDDNRKLLTYHDSWAYWAREYGFDVIGAVQASDFSDPSAREVAELIDQIRAQHVPAVFGSEVFPSTVLEQIASETGATYVDKLRDDEPPGASDAPEHTYMGMLRSDMQVMMDALGGQGTETFADYPVGDTWQP